MPLDPRTRTTDDDPRRLDPSEASRLAELATVAEQYAALLSSRPVVDADALIADACVDPLWDDRTNLLSLLADGPEELGLVLGFSPDDYMVVRYDAARGGWIVDDSPVDWEALEDRAFAGSDDEAGR
jgi:hypothetical protein